MKILFTSQGTKQNPIKTSQVFELFHRHNIWIVRPVPKSYSASIITQDHTFVDCRMSEITLGGHGFHPLYFLIVIKIRKQLLWMVKNKI